MCGICGYIHLDRTKQVSADILTAMADTIRPRGPDDAGVYAKGPVALGHRRLSIIDLSTGHQPMSNEDGSLTIVYNGEIYNFQDLKADLEKRGHAFRTHSDTEVVIHAYEEYGESCLDRFNGMFAFALWDAKRELLFLARDRFGKKPLYYACFDNQFIFGSELKAVLKHPSVRRRIDLASVSKYLAYEYVPSPHSIFRDIYKLEAGSKLVLKGGQRTVSRFWDISFERSRPFDPEEAKRRLVELLKESVRKRLVSDVPLGVFLSGGIDSSSVVAMMADLMDPQAIKTFSVGFREKSYDESSDARLVASHFGTDHHEEMLDPSTMLEVLPKIIDLLDEPFADSSIIPTYLVSRFTRRSVTVALGGDGGDELFLGYPSFLAHRINSVFSFIPDALKRAPVEALTGVLPPSHAYMSMHFKAMRFARGLRYPESVRHQAWIGSFTPDEQERLFLPGSGLSYAPGDIYAPTGSFYERVRDLDPLDRAIYIYAKTYMTDDILTKVDRASMANSLEVRAPFLDADFAAYAATIPPAFKLRNFQTKWILKEAMKDRLPASIIAKKKQGFAVPVAKWLKEDLKDLLMAAFDKKKIDREGIFSYDYIKVMLREYLEGRKDLRKEIWALFMFEMWYDKWMRT